MCFLIWGERGGLFLFFPKQTTKLILNFEVNETLWSNLPL